MHAAQMAIAYRWQYRALWPSCRSGLQAGTRWYAFCLAAMYFYTGITKKLYGDFLVYALCQHAKRCTIICINMQIVIINILPKISIYLPSDLGYVIFLVCHQSSCLHRALMSVCVDFSQNLHIYRIMLYIVIEHYFWKIRTPNVLLPRSKKNTKN